MIIGWTTSHSLVFIVPFDCRRRFVALSAIRIRYNLPSLFCMTFCVNLSLNWIRTHLTSMERHFSRRRTTLPYTLICGLSWMEFAWVVLIGLSHVEYDSLQIPPRSITYISIALAWTFSYPSRPIPTSLKVYERVALEDVERLTCLVKELFPMMSNTCEDVMKLYESKGKPTIVSPTSIVIDNGQ